MELTDAIKEHVNEKVGSLEKYFDNIIEARVDVGKTTDHHQKGDVFRAEVNLQVPGTLLRAEAVEEDLYKAINEVKNELQRQLVEYKEKMRSN
jgi:putative sigma-54 modulation protein